MGTYPRGGGGFQGVPGNSAEGIGGRGRILTDLSGPFNTVVQEIEVESLAAWERQRAEIFSRPDFQERQTRTADVIESGRVEFYTIEA